MASRHLGDWVERVAAQQGLDLDPSRRPFFNNNNNNNNKAGAQDPPLLRLNRAPNHILLYPGSFNPPHKGHLVLLNHVMRNAGADLSLMAAVIVLTDDDKLAAKNSKDETPFVLDRARRVCLWREAAMSPDRCWVFERSQDAWVAFRAQLERSLARDKIHVKFLLLVGPDWISSRSMTDPKSWGCAEAVTSDVSRPVDFRYPSSLRQLPGCSMWERRSLQAAKKALPSAAAMEAGGVETRSLASPGAPDGAVWTCQTLQRPLRRYRFVPCDLPSLSQGGEAPSSTAIRRAIATCRGQQQLEAELRKTALGPSLLAQYALDGGPYTAPVASKHPPDHEARKELAATHVQW